jgi:hypothetical protein
MKLMPWWDALAWGGYEHVARGQKIDCGGRFGEVVTDLVGVGTGLGGQLVDGLEQVVIDAAKPVPPPVGLLVGDDRKAGRLEERAVIADLRGAFRWAAGGSPTW